MAQIRIWKKFKFSTQIESMVFWIKLYCHFFTQFEISKVILFTFFYFEDLFFKFNITQLKELFFALRFVVPKTKLTSARVNTQIKKKLSCQLFNLKYISNASFWNYSYCIDLCFKADYDDLKEISFVQLLVVSRKHSPTVAQARFF